MQSKTHGCLSVTRSEVVVVVVVVVTPMTVRIQSTRSLIAERPRPGRYDTESSVSLETIRLETIQSHVILAERPCKFAARSITALRTSIYVVGSIRTPDFLVHGLMQASTN